MTDNTTPTPLFATKMVQDLEKIAKERGHTDVRKVFSEMMVVYGIVLSKIPSTEDVLPKHLETALNTYIMATSLLPHEGEALYDRVTEGVQIYVMAEDAAKKGDSLAVVDTFGESSKMEYCFMPSSLVEIRDDALAERHKKAKRKQEIFDSVANTNAAAVPLAPTEAEPELVPVN